MARIYTFWNTPYLCVYIIAFQRTGAQLRTLLEHSAFPLTPSNNRPSDLEIITLQINGPGTRPGQVCPKVCPAMATVRSFGIIAAFRRVDTIYRPYEHSVHETVIPFTSSQLVDWNLYAGVLYPAPLLMRLAKRDWDNREDCKRNWSLANSPSPVTSDASNGNGHTNGANGTSWSPPSRIVPAIHLPTSYATHWNILLSKEYESRSLSLLKSGLYEVQLLPLPPMPETPDVSLFLLNVPSIRENYPPVSMNDTVFIRQLRPHNQTFQGLAFEARVYTVQRLAGTIVLRCDPLSHHWESGLFNVAWIPQQRHFTACHRALECIHAHLPKAPGVSVTSSNPIRPCATAWIFPEHSDLHLGEVNGMKQPPKMRPPHITWKDNDLNSEQKVRVYSVPTLPRINQVSLVCCTINSAWKSQNPVSYIWSTW